MMNRLPRFGALTATLMALLVVSLTPSSASATVIHQSERTFPGSSEVFPPLFAGAADDSGGPSAGDLYIGSLSGSVEKFSSDGTPTGVLITGAETPQGGFSLLGAQGFSGAVAVDGSTGANSGDVYVTDTEHGVVDKFGEAGAFICQITARPPASRSTGEAEKECDGSVGSATPDGSIEPAGIAVDPTSGDLWLSDSAHAAIDEFNPAGKYVAQIKDSHVTTPGRLAIDSAGDLYVTNAAPFFGATTTNDVVEFDGGAFVAVLDEDEPTAVAVDSGDEHVYVYEKKTELVAEYGPAGALIDTFQPAGVPPLNVEGLAVSETGHIYVMQTAFFGQVEEFGPDLTVPTVVTESATTLTETSATLNGHVDPDAANGGGPVTGCEFEYVTNETFEVSGFQGAARAPCVPAVPLATPQAVTATVTLAPSTAYRFRLGASNANHVSSFGAARTMVTAGPPLIDDEKASVLTAGGVTLSATVDASGSEAACRVEYVDQPSYEQSGFATASTRPCAPASIPGSATAQAVSVPVTGLRLATSYHYRFVSRNQSGTTNGADQTFATFGIKPNSFSFQVLDAEGHPDTRAGAHPYEWTTSFAMSTASTEIAGHEHQAAAANLRTVESELPPGLIAGVTATPRCSRVEVSLQQCPAATQVGEIFIENARGETYEKGLYNVVPPEGVPVELGAVVANLVRVYVDGNVRTDGDYGATAKVVSVSAEDNIVRSRVAIWGVPQDPSHDARRVCPIPGEQVPIGAGCPATGPLVPLLTNPSSCPGTPLTATLRVDSWQAPNQFVSASSETPATAGCSALDFTPKIQIQPDTSVADSPSGLNLNLEVPQNETPEGRATSALKDTTVALPVGVSVSPSAAGGLEACSEAQIGLRSDAAPACPNGSKIGTVEVTSPLISDHLTGGVYLAAQKANPFGSLLAMYIAAEADGARVKLAGRIDADPVTGQLTTTFTENPQLPFSDLKLALFGGPHGALRTPSACGTYSTRSSLTPWARPGEPVNADSPFQITSCPHTGFAPTFSAGTENPLGGAFSPFDLRLAREDGSQELGDLEATLPAGLLGSPKGIPYCPDAALASISEAEGTGRAQEEHPSCPAASQVGTVTVGAGPGSAPFFTNSGRAYLAGPYRGAPLSLAVVTPAVAGPFDLGTVVVRNALRVNPQTTQITAVSDPFPRILHGIPLDLRDIRVRLDRPDFTLNPTNCEAATITSRISSTGGATATPSEHFQVAGCERLSFKPKLSLTLKGPVKRTSNPALIANLTTKPGEANTARAQVTLPSSAFLDNAHIGTVCTRVQFAAGAQLGQGCPSGSVYGRAKAISPLLDKPLEGYVYLRSSSNKLPDLVAALNGQIEVALIGKTDSVKGALRNTFEAVPDAPVSSFHLELFGGKRGLIQMSSGFCAHPKASVKFTGQNGRVSDTTPVVASSCAKGRGKRRHDAPR